MAERKAVIKNADMSEDMQQDAVDCASQALEKYNIEKDIAAFIKKEFDTKYNPTWHCIVGRNFGSYVTHETKHFIYFYLGQVRTQSTPLTLPRSKPSISSMIFCAHCPSPLIAGRGAPFQVRLIVAACRLRVVETACSQRGVGSCNGRPRSPSSHPEQAFGARVMVLGRGLRMPHARCSEVLVFWGSNVS